MHLLCQSVLTLFPDFELCSHNLSKLRQQISFFVFSSLHLYVKQPMYSAWFGGLPITKLLLISYYLILDLQYNPYTYFLFTAYAGIGVTVKLYKKQISDSDSAISLIALESSAWKVSIMFISIFDSSGVTLFVIGFKFTIIFSFCNSGIDTKENTVKK